MFTTHRTSPLAFAKGQSLVDIAALVAGLRTCVPPVHFHDFLSVQGSLVHEYGLEPVETDLGYRLGNPVVLQHPLHVQVFHEHDVVLRKQPVHDAVDVRFLLPAHALVCLGEPYPCFLPVPRPLGFPHKFPLQLGDALFSRPVEVSVFKHFAVGGDDEILHTEVDSDLVSRVSEPDKFVVGDVHKDGKEVVPALGFREGRTSDVVLVLPESFEVEVGAPEFYILEFGCQRYVACLEGVAFGYRLRWEQCGLVVLLGLEPWEFSPVVEEVVVCAEHLSDRLFHHLGVLFLEPRIVGVFEQFPVEYLGEFGQPEGLPALLVGALLDVEEVVEHETVAAEYSVQFLGLHPVRVYAYFYSSEHRSVKCRGYNNPSL